MSALSAQKSTQSPGGHNDFFHPDFFEDATGWDWVRIVAYHSSYSDWLSCPLGMLNQTVSRKKSRA
jgi:hypothetical protein